MPGSEGARAARIWELDALRGLCIVCMVAIHFVFDLTYFGGLKLQLPAFYLLIKEYGGILFILISGICVTLGRRSARRGLIVLAAGMVITAVTAAMWRLGMAGRSILILFGVLHLLGCCMLLYPLFKRLPLPATAALGILLVVLGYSVQTLRVGTPLLYPLGLRMDGMASSDYFPLLPHMGFFMLGTVLGRTVYREKKTRLPRVNASAAPIRFFSFCGRQSLWIYLLHQPILYGIVMLLT